MATLVDPEPLVSLACLASREVMDHEDPWALKVNEDQRVTEERMVLVKEANKARLVP